MSTQRYKQWAIVSDGTGKAMLFDSGFKSHCEKRLGEMQALLGDRQDEKRPEAETYSGPTAAPSDSPRALAASNTESRTRPGAQGVPHSAFFFPTWKMIFVEGMAAQVPRPRISLGVYGLKLAFARSFLNFARASSVMQPRSGFEPVVSQRPSAPTAVTVIDSGSDESMGPELIFAMGFR